MIQPKEKNCFFVYFLPVKKVILNEENSAKIQCEPVKSMIKIKCSKYSLDKIRIKISCKNGKCTHFDAECN